MPLPPPDSKLVLAYTGRRSEHGHRTTGRKPGIYSPAFLLKEESDGSIRVLRGTDYETLQLQADGEPLLHPFSTNAVAFDADWYFVEFNNPAVFVCAVQAAAIGNCEDAEVIWQMFHKTYPNPYYGYKTIGVVRLKSKRDQKGLLGQCLYAWLRDDLLHDDLDKSDILARTKLLLKDFHELKKGRSGSFLKDLQAVAAAPDPEKGSVEELLLEWSSYGGSVYDLGIYKEGNGSDVDAPARKIIERGFDAVPDLIDLLDDRRVTAHYFHGFFTTGSASLQIERVGDLAFQLLSMIAGSGIHTNDRSEIYGWWERLGNREESEALPQGVFCFRDGKIFQVNRGTAYIVGKRFPEKLPVLCAEFVKCAEDRVRSYPLAQAIGKSDMSSEWRIKVLSEFAVCGSLNNKSDFLYMLAELDPEICKKLLIPVLEGVSKDSSKPCLVCPESEFTPVVMKFDDDEVWRVYLKAAKRSSVRARMQMMDMMDCCRLGTKNLNRRLAFLAAFLDDEAVRDMRAEEEIFCGLSIYHFTDYLSVRNFVAMKLASLLNIDESPDKDWDESRWEKLRNNVKDELSKNESAGFIAPNLDPIPKGGDTDNGLSAAKSRPSLAQAEGRM
jgi:hypothetical protein